MDDLTEKANTFEDGVFWAIQTVALDAVQAKQTAGFLLMESGLSRDQALALSKKTGYRVRDMNKIIREWLPEPAKAAK